MSRYWLLTPLLILACTVTAPAAMVAPTSLPKTPVFGLQKPANTPETPIPTYTDDVSPKSLEVIGCWNVRNAPSLDGLIVRVQCGGSVEFVQWSTNGWLELTDGEYICNRAVSDWSDECR